MSTAKPTINPYYHPEQLGLEIVYQVDAIAGYEFDMLVIWRRTSDGALLMATDSGCSCPVPFDDCELETATPEAVREWFDEDDGLRRGQCGAGECERALKVFDVPTLP